MTGTDGGWTSRPRKEAAAAPGALPTDAADTPLLYRSSFANWSQRASVRTKPLNRLALPGDGGLYFSPELVPEAGHPLIDKSGRSLPNRLLVHRLYQYLHFTVDLEQLAVIPLAIQISRGEAGLSLPAQMRADAFAIVTDESWHAQISYDLIRQVENETGETPLRSGVPAFANRLETIRSHIDERVRGVENLLFGVVSETLISAYLADLPRDKRLPAAVSRLVRDHAEDEGRHHAYFRDVLHVLWAALDKTERRLIGPHIPDIIEAFLRPDLSASRNSLIAVGLSTNRADQVIAESYPPEQVARSTAESARTTVRYFADVGALDDAQTREAFEAASMHL